MLRKETKDILKKYDIWLSKRKSQSQVVEEGVLKRMVDYGKISPSDSVLEVGSGIGNLTKMLLERAGKVIAIERDDRLVEILKDRLSCYSNLKIINDDVLEVDLPSFNKVVSNLPYSISSPFTFELLERKFDLAVLMYQKEFAERLTAKPESSSYSRLSVNVSFRAEVTLLEIIPPGVFFPRPEVSSAVVRMKPSEPSFVVYDEAILHRVVKAAFQHRRKKLRNSLSNSLGRILQRSDLSDSQERKIIEGSLPRDLADRRPENISPEDFGKIANSFVEWMFTL